MINEKIEQEKDLVIRICGYIGIFLLLGIFVQNVIADEMLRMSLNHHHSLVLVHLHTI